MKKLMILPIAAFLTLGANAKNYTITSPDGNIALSVDVEKDVQWRAIADGQDIIAPSTISMTLQSGKVLGANPRVSKTRITEVDRRIPTPFSKNDSITEAYRQLRIDMAGGYALEFRAYDNAVAYRFVTDLKGRQTVMSERAEFNMPGDFIAWVPYVNDNRSGERYTYSFESYYDAETPINEMYADSLAITPLVVQIYDHKIAISDFGAEDYPGMFLKGIGGDLIAEFAPVPLEGYMGGYNELNYIPTKRADYIAADVEGRRAYPWRAVIVARNDTELAEIDMAHLLSAPSRIADTSWIKPGKVAWDWWNDLYVTGVDFKVGRNTPTYKYYIDFAAENGIEYIIVDEGWSDENSILKTRGDIDVAELARYGREKGVGVILWASWKNVHRELDEAMRKYSDMGIAGLKVDFFDADDQNMMRDMQRFAESAAKHHMLLDYHGMKANGMQVTYPNIVNFEGVKGLENYKWSSIENDPPRYAVTAPYIRTIVGPMDYTPGAMINLREDEHRPSNSKPASEGTRCNQLAMYIVYDAPLQMLADSPVRYRANQCCTDIMAAIPTFFDETKVLDGKLGEYIVTMRRVGDTWYVGAMTNRTPRDLVLDLSFLPEGAYTMTYVADGINYDKDAADHIHGAMPVTSASRIPVHMSPAGGWVAIIK